MITQSHDGVILRFRCNGREVRRFFSSKPVRDDDEQVVSYFAPTQRAYLEAQRLSSCVNERGLRGLSRDDLHILNLPPLEDYPQDEIMPQVGYLDFPANVSGTYAASLGNQRESDLIRGLVQTERRRRQQLCRLWQPEPIERDERQLSEALL